MPWKLSEEGYLMLAGIQALWMILGYRCIWKVVSWVVSSVVLYCFMVVSFLYGMFHLPLIPFCLAFTAVAKGILRLLDAVISFLSAAREPTLWKPAEERGSPVVVPSCGRAEARRRGDVRNHSLRATFSRCMGLGLCGSCYRSGDACLNERRGAFSYLCCLSSLALCSARLSY